MNISINLAALLERFFTERLMQQRQASPHTISSYSETFRQFLTFTEQRIHKAPSRLNFQEIDTPLIMAFLDHLEKHQGVSARSRCIVGSARLGFSPSPYKFGQPFSETSDVDVVLISEPLFLEGSQALLQELNGVQPGLHLVKGINPKPVQVEGETWRKVKEAIRNFVFNNFNPGLLPYDHSLRQRIFDGIASTTGLFLALEPQIFVSKIRCRVFRSWKAAEDYYANSLRQAQGQLTGAPAVDIVDDDDEVVGGPPVKE